MTKWAKILLTETKDHRKSTNYLREFLLNPFRSLSIQNIYVRMIPTCYNTLTYVTKRKVVWGDFADKR